MSVTLSDEAAALVHEALEAGIMITDSSVETLTALYTLEDQAYLVMCDALGVTAQWPSSATTS